MPNREPPSEPRTWHYGLVATWWAEFHHGGPEIEFLRPLVDAGRSALDVACGTGRVLIPLLRDGFDIDGSDVSPDMLARCRELAEREGLARRTRSRPRRRRSRSSWRRDRSSFRLRGRDPEFVVTPPPNDPSVEEVGEVDDASAWPDVVRTSEGDEGAISRINLRLPEHLKSRIERVAAEEGLSVNSWLVRAAAAALDRTDPPRRRERRTPHGAQRYTGWAR